VRSGLASTASGRRTRRVAAVGVASVLLALALPACTGGGSGSPAPSPTSPIPSPGRVIPNTAACIRYTHVECYEPSQLQRAYDLEPLYQRHLDGTGETIAVVVSFGSPTIRQDLETFDRNYHLPDPPNLTVIQPSGKVPPFDANDSSMFGWARETSMDVEWAHALAPGANILLVETPVAETEGVHGFPQMIHAENDVIDHGMADVISQSFGATEETFPSDASIQRLRTAYRNAQAHDVTVVAATSDQGATSYTKDAPNGYYPVPVVDWPGSDPLVTAVGGTRVRLDANGNRIAPDSVWNETHDPLAVEHPPTPSAGGGGVSHVFARPSYQDGVEGVVGRSRGVPDVSLSAAHRGAVLVYEGFHPGHPGYYLGWGVSEAVPEFAAIAAIADQAAGHRLGLLNPLLYRLGAAHAPGLVDVVTGNNTVAYEQDGLTHTVPGWSAEHGYDLASGLGTVDAAKLVDELVAASREG
jgi:subtilase family serine protease